MEFRGMIIESVGRDDSFLERGEFSVVILFFSRTPASSFDFQRCTTAFSVYSLYILARTWKIERVNASLMRVSNIFSENFSAQTEGNIFEWEVG